MTEFTPDSFSEHDLRRALAGRAATVQARPDRARLDQGLRRADRVRTLRAAALSGVTALAVTFGVLNLNGTTESSTVDVVDQPDIGEPSTPTLPEIGDPEGEIVLVEATTTTTTPAPTTTTAAPTTTSAATAPTKPDHLVTPESTTTVAPVTTTTMPPSTTAAPATTAPPTTTTTHSPTTTAGVTLTANARYGTCELDPPYDVYDGTATPGVTITIDSPWTDPVQTVAGSDGHWEITVFFPNAPVDEPFTVAITDGVDTRSLGFVRTG